MTAITHMTTRGGLITAARIANIGEPVSRRRGIKPVLFGPRWWTKSPSFPVSPTASRAAYFATAEDLILSKLEWFRLGGESSDRQWGDVLGVLRVQGSALDRPYLRRWAKQLGLTDLLDRALKESEL